MGTELLAFVNPVAPAPTNPILAFFFYVLLTPIAVVLQFLDHTFRAWGPTHTIGAFGVSVIVLTLLIRALLFPLFRWQIRTQWRVQADNRKVAPELKALQAKHKGDRRRLQEEQMALYRRHQINPLSQLSGCLPLVIQMPFLYALYGVIHKFTENGSLHHQASFLFLPNLADSPFKTPGGIAAHPEVLVVPLLAGLLTFMQSKMMMQPLRPDMSDQERQMYRVMSQTTYLMPVVIAFFALNFQLGIGLYWITQSAVMVLQVFSMMGWGGLRVPPWFPGASWRPRHFPMAPAPATGGNGAGMKVVPDAPQRAAENGRSQQDGTGATRRAGGGSGRRNRGRGRSRR
ncbi:MAG: YidC/Oxa1 family membrane protein insertase [Candidatus Dormibacteria bacterium]